MEVRVRIPTPLRELVAGARTVVLDIPSNAARPAGVAPDAVTVRSVLDTLAVEHPALERRVRDELGRTRAHVNLFVGADNIRDREGLGTTIASGQELSILPAVSGG